MSAENSNSAAALESPHKRLAFELLVTALVSLLATAMLYFSVEQLVLPLQAWLMLVIILNLLQVPFTRLWSRSASPAMLSINRTLLVLLSLFWGVLPGLTAAYAGGEAQTGLWIALLLTTALIGLFEHPQSNGWLWLAGFSTALLAAAAWQYQNISWHNAAVMALAYLGWLLLLVSARKEELPSVSTGDFEKLQKEYDDLQIAFNAQDSAIVAETRLRQAVEESLRHANRIAEVASRSKTEFMATIGHEIRTPLNGIIPILEMLEESGLNAEQLNLVKTASHSSYHLLRIINDILDFSKAEVGKLEIESIEMNLHELVYSVSDLMQQSAESKGLKMQVNIAPDVPQRVRGDSLRLKQIITNLLSNALKFTEQGSISLEITLRNKSVREVELMFAVRDTGIGMSEMITRKLFQSFTQADASTTRNYGGTGLGLAICKRLVELMGGEIGVHSQQGKGSTFWFFLPMRKSLLDVPALRDNIEDAQILYFLKNSKNTAIYEMIQGECKVHVEMARDLNDALQRLKAASAAPRKAPFDLVVVDVIGSEFTAVNDLQVINRAIQGSLTQTLVINALPSLERELRDAGGSAVLMRPFNAEMFRQTLFRLLDIGLTTQSEEITDNTPLLESMFVDANPGHIGSESQNQARQLYQARVLLAEDNPVNRDVAVKLLQGYGLEVDVAMDGYEALEAMQKTSYDLVFMDCQMPRMDGFEATRLWRRHEQEQDDLLTTHRRTVIIAITANAMRGDREKCIAAKMDDYLPKPLNRAALSRMLAKWLSSRARGKSPKSARTMTSSHAAPPPEDSVLDASVLNELRQVMGDDYRQVIHSYLQHSSELFTRMKHMASKNNLEEVTRSVHSFKSSSKNVGAVALGNQAQALETKLRNAETVDLDASIRSLLIAYDQVARELGKLL